MKLDPDTLGSLPLSLRTEIEENVQRKPLTQSELAAEQRRILAALREQKMPGQRNDLNEGGATCEKDFSQVRATAIVGKLYGESHKQVEKRLAVVDAAAAEPHKHGRLLADMDRTGRVNGPYRRLRNAQQAEAIRAEPPPLPMQGSYCAGIIDIPWASEPGAEGDRGNRAYWPYPTQTPAQVAAMPVPSILAADASVWMWITNFHLMHGCHLPIANAWGLRPVALFTWVKKRWGNGIRARGATEHLIQLVRGDVPILGQDTPTWFEGDEGGVHSQKPEQAYALVEKLSPAPRYFELFSRNSPRERWDLHGDEVGKLAPREGHADDSNVVEEPDLPDFLRRAGS